MKNIKLFVMAIVAIFMVSCKPDCSYKEEKGVEFNPENMKVNPKEKLDVQRVEFQLVEGHSHARPQSRTKIGGVMWCTDFKVGSFHGNPYNYKTKLPLKRHQYLVYDKQEDGSYKKFFSTNEPMAFNILSSTPRKKYLNGVENALIVRLYGKDKKRIDLALKADSLKNRVQVFYQVIDVRPSLPKYSLPKDYDSKDICYYWYFDRRPVWDAGKLYGDGEYIQDEAIGFRGVVQSLEPRTKFILRMSVTVLPKGMKKSSTLENSISPSKEQAQHVVFQFDIPFLVITEYPNFSNKAQDEAEKKFGKTLYDFNDDEYKYYNELSEKLKKQFFIELQEIYTDYSVNDIEKYYEEQLRQDPEMSDFYL